MKRAWTAVEDRAIRARYPHESTAALAASLGRSVRAVYERGFRFGLKKTPEYFAKHGAGRLDGIRGGATRFKAGQVSWNKGIPGSTGTHPNSRAHQFRTGRPACEARNYQPIGTERVCRDGYIERKVTDDPNVFPARRWVGVHRLLWEEHLGPVPAGFAVTFKNGDKQDVRIDNLALTPRALLMKRNSYHNNYPKEVALLIQLRGALNRKINRRAA